MPAAVVGSIKSVLNEERQAAQAAIWEGIEVGKHYDGVVKSMTSYGVFVDIGGVDGMVHISELSWSRIKNPAEVVSIGNHLDIVRHLLRPRSARFPSASRIAPRSPGMCS